MEVLRRLIEDLVRSVNDLLARVGRLETLEGGGATADVAVAKDGGGTRTLHFVNGVYTGFTDS